MAYDQAKFDEIYKKENPWNYNGHDHLLDIIAVLPSIEDSERLKLKALEIGSGEGHVSQYLKDHFGHLTCCEISEIAHDRAVKRFENDFIRKPEFIHGNFLEISLPAFDFIIALDVLYYMDSDKMVKKILQCSHPGTQLLIEEIYAGMDLSWKRFQDTFRLKKFNDHGGFGVWLLERI